MRSRPMFRTVFLSTGQWPNITKCSIERKTVPSDRAVAQYYNVFNRKEDSSYDRAVALILSMYII